MKPQRPEYNPAKTFIFILIGAVLVIVTDLFVFGGKQIIWREKQDKQIITSFVDIEELQRRHEKYMKDGILPPHSTARPSETFTQAEIEENVKPFMPPDLFELIEEKDLPQSRANELAEADRPEVEMMLPEDLLQALEPASGAPDEDVLASTFLEEPKKNFLGQEKFGPPAPPVIEAMEEEAPPIEEPIAVEQVEETPEPVQETATAPVTSGGKIAIIIDDMGLTLRGRQLEVMQYPLTLAYLPYAENLAERTTIARQNGHELMLHMPMQAMNGNDGGPRVLEVTDSPEEFEDTLHWGLTQFEGFVGVNNHMGSRLTQDKASMEKVMAALKQRGLYFIDSKTIGSSVAASTAAENGLAYNERDVFLDHVITREFVDNALKTLEAVARRKGYAIAIGHPHKETVEALKDWLPTLEAKGITLVPASALVRKDKIPQPELQISQTPAAQEIPLDAELYNTIEPSASNTYSETQ